MCQDNYVQNFRGTKHVVPINNFVTAEVMGFFPDVSDSRQDVLLLKDNFRINFNAKQQT